MELTENQKKIIKIIIEDLKFIKSTQQNEQLLEVLEENFKLYQLFPHCPICQSDLHISGECEVIFMLKVGEMKNIKMETYQEPEELKRDKNGRFMKGHSFSRKYYTDEEIKKAKRENSKKFRQNNPEKVKKYDENYRKNNPKIKRVQRLALQVPLKPCCSFCGSTKYLIRHHKDYNKPLDIITLCSSCHKKLHQNGN
jgi:hypothetical protein